MRNFNLMKLLMLTLATVSIFMDASLVVSVFVVGFVFFKTDLLDNEDAEGIARAVAAYEYSEDRALPLMFLVVLFLFAVIMLNSIIEHNIV